MSLIILGALGGALVYLGYRQITGTGHHLIALPILGLLFVALGWTTWTKHQLEAELTRVTRELTDLDNVTVQCQTILGSIWDPLNPGWVEHDSNGNPATISNLSRNTCKQLRTYLNSPKTNPTTDQIIAVHILTHEATHLTGDFNEASTECTAVQRNNTTAKLLGATEHAATELQTRYWTEVYPRMNSTYRTSDCAANGRLDKTPGDGTWP